MNLPVLLPDLKSQLWDCHGCTSCCRELVVHLTQRDVDEIERQGWRQRMSEPPYIRLGRERVLNHQPGGGCVFLTEDGRCRIHAEFGAEAKPLACRLYPFTLHHEGDAIRAGLRFDCPSAVSNSGSALSSHRKHLTRLVAELHDAGQSLLGDRAAPACLTDGRRLTNAEQHAFVRCLDSWLRDANRPLSQRLLGMYHLICTLSRAKLQNVRDEEFVELLDLLAIDLPAATDELRAQAAPPPSSREGKLLRMNIFAHCEHVTLAQARRSFLAGLAYRFDQLSRARRFVRGVGPVPKLVAGFLGGSFAEVARITCPIEVHRQIDELLTRYLRVRLLGGTAFGAGYYGWAAVDGLSALLLAVCCVDWLARYFTVTEGRAAIMIEDVNHALGVVDRTAGRARELGTRAARLRVRYLASEGGIERLVRSAGIVGWREVPKM